MCEVSRAIVFYKHNRQSALKLHKQYGSYPGPTKKQYDGLPVMDYDEAMAFRDSQMEK